MSLMTGEHLSHNSGCVRSSPTAEGRQGFNLPFHLLAITSVDAEPNISLECKSASPFVTSHEASCAVQLLVKHKLPTALDIFHQAAVSLSLKLS